MPTLKAMWSPEGQQVMIPTPAQPKKRYGIGAVNYHTGESVVLIRRRKRRREVAELLEALLEKHPRGIVHVGWDNSNTHEDEEIEAVLRGAAGRLVLLYLPTYSPWLNPIEMLWRHFRREVTHCELFPNIKKLVEAAYDFFARYNRCPWRTLSIIGSNPDITGFAAAGAGYRRDDAVLAEHSGVATGPQLTVLTRTPRGSTSK
jgi:transposase